MTSTTRVKLSEKTVRDCLSNPPIKTIRHEGSRLQLRINTARTGGSWYLVDFQKGKAQWHKLGNYPAISVKAVLAELPGKEQQLLVDRQASLLVSQWQSVSDLLQWYLARITSDANLTAERKAVVKSNIECHLLSMLGDIALSDVNRSVIDDQLIWPLQEKYSLSHVRSIYSVLKTAFKQAQVLNKITINPLAGLSFTDFIASEIKPKDGRLRSMNFPSLLEQLKACPKPHLILILLMICFGTRIGETRKARWCDFDFDDGFWFMPAKNTKTRQAHRLPLTKLSRSILQDYASSLKLNNPAGFLFTNGTEKVCISARTATSWVASVSKGEWSAHDLRKLARTQWTDQGVDYMIGELLLNHALTKLDKTYIHTYAETQMRAALEQYHAWLEAQNIGSVTETIPRQTNSQKTPNVTECLA